MRFIFLLLAAIICNQAHAAGPIIWYGTNSKDLTSGGLITPLIQVGTTTLVTTGAGNVGIGTTTPAVKLDVVGAIAVNETLFPAGRASSTVGTASFSASPGAWNAGLSWLEIEHDSTGSIIAQNSGNKDLRFYAKDAGGIRRGPLTINPDGLVGIGTITPVAKLDITGTSNVSQLVVRAHTTQGPYVISTFNSAGIQAFGISEYGGIERPAAALGDLPIVNYSGDSITLHAGGLEVMRIQGYGTGNVGIGTASPNEQLEITKSFRIPATTATNGIIKQGANRFIHSFGAGTSNIFAGQNAGNLTNTTGGATGVGSLALSSISSGTGNTATGYAALNAVTTGSDNTAVGGSALASSTSSDNTAVGSFALTTQTTGAGNTGLGSKTLQNNTTGSNNTASGAGALLANTTGFSNTASGWGSLQSNTTGFSNTASGMQALQNNTTGANNTASGVAALAANTTGIYNTASGYYALPSNTTGNYNVASGAQALYSNTTAEDNTAIGVNALYSNTTGFANTASGRGALQNNNGSSNTASGKDSLLANTTGSNNTAFGHSALQNNTTGNNNTAIGQQALTTGTEGVQNTVVGFASGGGITTGSHNTILGANVTGLSNPSNNIILADGQGNIKARNDGTDWNLTGNVGIGTTTPTSKLSVGASSEFQVNSTGNIVRINDVVTSFPAAQGAANTFLKNDGAGVLSWATGVPNTRTRRSDTTTTSATCSVTCSAGETATGGGCQNTLALNLVNSYPSADDTWTCEYTLATGDCTAWAVCFNY